MAWYVIAAVFFALALLAYKWTYSIVGWDAGTRRNLQWLLIVVLVLAGIISALRGANV